MRYAQVAMSLRMMRVQPDSMIVDFRNRTFGTCDVSECKGMLVQVSAKTTDNKIVTFEVLESIGAGLISKLTKAA